MFLFHWNTYRDQGFCKAILCLQIEMFWGKKHHFEDAKGKTTQRAADGMGTAVSPKTTLKIYKIFQCAQWYLY